MKDPADNKTLSLIDETVTKKRGRPATGNAMTAAQRKAQQRFRDRERVLSADVTVTEWTKKDCIVVLTDRRSSIAMQQMAARQLVVLLSDNHVKGE